jgi:hypothetical protein
MIAHARTPSRFGVVGPTCTRFGECGSLRPINLRRGRGSPIPCHLALLAPCLLLSFSGCAPLRFRSPLASPSLTTANCNGAHLANPGAGPATVASLDGDGLHAERARERRPAGAECGRATSGMDRSAGGGSGAQPAVRLRGQLHPAPRTRLHRAGEPLHAWIMPPLRGGVAQLCPERVFTGGHLRRRP